MQSHSGSAETDARNIKTTFEALMKHADELNLTVREKCALLALHKSSYYRWLEHGPKVDPDKRERMSILLSIFERSDTKFEASGGSKWWLLQPNHDQLCNGSRPIDLLLSGGFREVVLVEQLLTLKRTP
ncbi:MAG: hypothetical protein HYZ13_03070 [Acidobacteria bacterium]|nr:hypothetical protein [Acidobacteriota bacterium]